ncbi:MAG: hypothetical protein QM214_01610 [Bacillota bacterium]|jgi:hypothetical protein|nr:hypothetical protein [Bacillota bacterium]HHU43795.1 hypothetical protein [Clostridiales bacterium]
MLDILLKKARGYVIKEIVEEYCVDENGEEKLLKRKVHQKHIPPDTTALKEYLKHQDEKLMDMSEEELQKEKQRLLNELSKKSKNRSA